MKGYVWKVRVALRHKDTFKEVSTQVEVWTEQEDAHEALLIGLQVACTHREGWMPIDGRIVSVVL